MTEHTAPSPLTDDDTGEALLPWADDDKNEVTADVIGEVTAEVIGEASQSERTDPGLRAAS